MQCSYIRPSDLAIRWAFGFSWAIDPRPDASLYLCDRIPDGILHRMQLRIRVKGLMAFEQGLKKLERAPRRHAFDAGRSLVGGDPL